MRTRTKTIEETPIDFADEKAKLAQLPERLLNEFAELQAKLSALSPQVEAVAANCGRLSEQAKTAELAQNYRFGASQVLIAIGDVSQALDAIQGRIEATR